MLCVHTRQLGDNALEIIKEFISVTGIVFGGSFLVVRGIGLVKRIGFGSITTASSAVNLSEFNCKLSGGLPNDPHHSSSYGASLSVSEIDKT